MSSPGVQMNMCPVKLNLDDPLVHAGWAILLAFIGESIVNGSKEVSLAAIASLNPLLISHAAKVTISVFLSSFFYLVFCIYFSYCYY